MPRRAVPKYTLHRSSGQARVRIDGRDHYLGLYDTPESHQQYSRLIAGWLKESEITHRDFPALTVGELSLAFLEHAKAYYVKHGEPSGHMHMIRNGLKYLVRAYRHLPAAEFGPKKLTALRDQLIVKRFSRKYVNDLISVVKRAFRWAASEELITVTVHQALLTVGTLVRGRSAAHEPDPVGPVSDAAVDAIRGHVSPAVWGLVQFQLMTGARPGEALILRGCDLNMAGDVWEFTPHRHKLEHKDKARVLMIGPAGQSLLQEFLRHDLTAYLFSPDEEGERPYRRDSYRNAITRGCETAFGMPKHLRNINAHVARQADLTEAERKALRRKLLDEAAAWRRENVWSPNQLRHSFATRARRAGGIEAARVTLGHSSAVTSEIYAERDLDSARAVAAKIG